MSSTQVPALPAAFARPTLSRSAAAGLASALAVLGVVSIWPTALALRSMWVNDPLKSIGMLVPLVSFALILQRWRALQWTMDGSWWGLVLLAGTSLAVRFREQSVLVLILSPRWSIFFPPHSLVAFAYVVGVVLLFGGPRLLRAARFPVLLIWLVNPVPHIFNVYVDLPLQRVSAHVARAFAIALHQKLTPDQMRLMFTPEFGMFIAPGCNGIRGAVTMGMIALIAGHLYRFRFRTHAFFVGAAVLLGYVFNFVRLCTLVVYYIVALKIPWLQTRAETGDYILGAVLFLGAVALLFHAIGRFTGEGSSRDRKDETDQTASGDDFLAEPKLPVWRGAPARLVAMAIFLILTGARFAHGLLPGSGSAKAPALSGETGFPVQIGRYARLRTWEERLVQGPLIFVWADYRLAGQTTRPDGDGALPAGAAADARGFSADGGEPHVAVGISPVLGAHDTSICHSARGEDPVWHGELRAATRTGTESFNSSFFSTGASQYLEVTTVCSAGGCGEYSVGRQGFGLLYSRPAPAEAFSRDPKRPIPVMLRIETGDTAVPADLARQQLTAAAETFLAGADLVAMTEAYRR